MHAGNFGDVPMRAAFFVGQSDVVRFASFQLQAETGRGVLRSRADARIDRTTPMRTGWLSELLDFHPEDFVPRAAPSLLAHADRYAPRPTPGDFAVRFTPDDGTIANQRPAR